MQPLISLIVGVFAGISAWLVVTVVNARRKVYEQAHEFERQRREKIRESSLFYRLFEPAIDEISPLFRRKYEKNLKKLDESIAASGETVPWKAEDYVATSAIECSCYSLMIFLLLIFVVGFSLGLSLLLGVVIGGVVLWTALSKYSSRAEKRRRKIKRDFSAAIDLLALMLEVGGGFLASIHVVAEEFKTKHLGKELLTIISDIELGVPLKTALTSFAGRMSDDDISEVVFAINESEELGVPIAKTLRDQADRMRQKRSTWAEKAGQEAEVALTFPAMIIMIACMLTVAGPFLLSGIGTWAGMI